MVATYIGGISMLKCGLFKCYNHLQLTCGVQCNEWRHRHLKVCPWVCLGTAMNRRGDGRAQRRSERYTRQTRGRKRLPDDGVSINVTNSDPPSTPPAAPSITQRSSHEQKNDSEVAVHHNSASLVSSYMHYFLSSCVSFCILSIFCESIVYLLKPVF